MYFKIEYINKGKSEEIIISAKTPKEAVKKFRLKKLGILRNIQEYHKDSISDKLIKKLDLAKIDLDEYISVLEQI